MWKTILVVGGTGQPITYQAMSLWPGDPPMLIGDAAKAMHELGWRPLYPDLQQIIKTAWSWVKDRSLPTHS